MKRTITTNDTNDLNPTTVIRRDGPTSKDVPPIDSFATCLIVDLTFETFSIRFTIPGFHLEWC